MARVVVPAPPGSSCAAGTWPASPAALPRGAFAALAETASSI